MRTRPLSPLQMRRPILENKTMTSAFILIALALIIIYAGPTLLFICVGYVDYMLERRRHLVALRHAVRRRSDEF
jgi:hypothetical protein